MKRLLTISLAIAACSACVREIDIENQTADITSVGALSMDSDQNVLVPFTIRDLEGDDQIVAIDICDAPGENCGIASDGGGDPLDRLPAVPKDTDVEHEFHWQPWCGRYLNDAFEAIALDAEFVVAVSVLSTPDRAVYSEPTSLAELGAVEGTCDE